jgi:phosphatidate cytidylyltransferase
MLSLSPRLLAVLAVMFAALAVGTLIRVVMLRGAAPELIRSRVDSLRTWWLLACLFAVAVAIGELGVLLALVTVALLGVLEFLGLLGWPNVGRPTATILFLLVPLYYLMAFVLSGQQDLILQIAPVVFFLLIGGMRSWLGLTQGYVRTTAALFWGLILFVYSPSHAYLLVQLPGVPEPWVGRIGWVLYLVLLTETNDIMQAIIGRRFGTRKITPTVSPNKSMEGLVGGVLATSLLGVLTAPWLTSLTLNRSFAMGVLVSLAASLSISFFGFLGDINMSGIKRDVGVKDGSRLLPGQGGMMDRIDSLTFTAPVFYYFVRLAV